MVYFYWKSNNIAADKVNVARVACSMSSIYKGSLNLTAKSQWTLVHHMLGLNMEITFCVANKMLWWQESWRDTIGIATFLVHEIWDSAVELKTSILFLCPVTQNYFEFDIPIMQNIDQFVVVHGTIDLGLIQDPMNPMSRVKVVLEAALLLSIFQLGAQINIDSVDFTNIRMAQVGS